MIFTPINIEQVTDKELRHIIKNNNFIDMSSTGLYTLTEIVKTIELDHDIIFNPNQLDTKHIEGTFYKSYDNSIVFIIKVSIAANVEYIESFVNETSSHLTDYTVIDDIKYFFIYPFTYELIL
jgi:hypothetical protein